MIKIITLERDAPPNLERVYVVLDQDDSPLGVVGPRTIPNMDLDLHLRSFVGMGFDEESFVCFPVVQVGDDEMRMFLRSWWDSRPGILQRARKACGDKGCNLGVEATAARFDGASDRDLAAALWFLWLDGKHTGVCLGNCSPAAGYPTNEVCQIGLFALYLDSKGAVSFDEFASADAAAQHVSRIAAQREDGT